MPSFMNAVVNIQCSNRPIEYKYNISVYSLELAKIDELLQLSLLGQSLYCQQAAVNNVAMVIDPPRP